MTDGELLAEFRRTQTPDLMSEIVVRHSGRVYAICRRILRDDHAAEDATQATFVTLFEKAGKLRPGVLLAGWLYMTAQQTSWSSRRRKMRAQIHEKKAGIQKLGSTEATERADAWPEAQPLLDELLASLNVMQRDAILLCCLYGRTQAEAAREIGCPEDTLRSRLNTGLQRLREKFRARGFELSAAALVAMLAPGADLAPPATLTAQLQSIALGKTNASTEALLLVKAAKGSGHAGLWIALLSIGLLGAGAALFLSAETKKSGGDATKTVLAPPAPQPHEFGLDVASWEFVRVKPRHIAASGNIPAALQLTNEVLDINGFASTRLPELPAAFAIEAHVSIDKVLKAQHHAVRISVSRNGVDDDVVHPERGTSPRGRTIDIQPGVPFVVRLEFRPSQNGSGVECRLFSDGRPGGTRQYDAAPNEFYLELTNATMRCLGLSVMPLPEK
jgi:RNA polymerase sigma factor (sigma-70 family)